MNIQKMCVSRIVLLAIALISVSDVRAVGTEKPDKEVKYTCGSVDVRDARVAVHKKFDEMVKHALNLNTTDLNMTQYITNLNNSLNHFNTVVVKYCLNNTKELPNKHYSIYIDMINYLFKNATKLQDLTQNGAFSCINKNVDAITQCANNTGNITKGNYTLMAKKMALTFNVLSCGYIGKTKECVSNILSNETSCNLAKDYVDGLFDIVISGKCINNETNSAVKITSLWNTSILVCIWSVFIKLIS